MEPKVSYGACPQPQPSSTVACRRDRTPSRAPSWAFLLFIVGVFYMAVWRPLGSFDSRPPEKSPATGVGDPMNPWENVSLTIPLPNVSGC